MNSQTISIGGITDNSKKQKSILDKMCYEMYIFTGHRANLLPWSEPLDFQDKLQNRVHFNRTKSLHCIDIHKDPLNQQRLVSSGFVQYILLGRTVIFDGLLPLALPSQHCN